MRFLLVISVLVVATAASAATAAAPRAVAAPAPVTALAMDGRLVAYAADRSAGDCDRIRIWNLTTRAVTKLGRTMPCDEGSTGTGIATVSIAGNRVLWLHYAGGNIREWRLFTATTTRPAPRQLAFEPRDVDGVAPLVVGPGDASRFGDLLPYALDHTVVALGSDGARRFSWRAPTRVTALAALGGQLAVASEGGEVTILDARGHVTATETFASEIQVVRLTGTGVLVQRGRTLELRSGGTTRTWLLPARASLRDANADAALYVTGGQIRELRLDAVNRQRQLGLGSDVQAELVSVATSAGRRVAATPLPLERRRLDLPLRLVDSTRVQDAVVADQLLERGDGAEDPRAVDDDCPLAAAHRDRERVALDLLRHLGDRDASRGDRPEAVLTPDCLGPVWGVDRPLERVGQRLDVEVVRLRDERAARERDEDRCLSVQVRRLDRRDGVPDLLPVHAVYLGLVPAKVRIPWRLLDQAAFPRELLVQRLLPPPERAHRWLLLGLDVPVPAVAAPVHDLGLPRRFVPEDEEVVPDELELERCLLGRHRLQVELLRFHDHLLELLRREPRLRRGMPVRATSGLAAAPLGSVPLHLTLELVHELVDRGLERVRGLSRAQGRSLRPDRGLRDVIVRDRRVVLERQLELDLRGIRKLLLELAELLLCVSPNRLADLDVSALDLESHRVPSLEVLERPGGELRLTDCPCESHNLDMTCTSLPKGRRSSSRRRAARVDVVHEADARRATLGPARRRG